TNTWNVIRGYNNTIASAHNANALVTPLGGLPAGSVTDLVPFPNATAPTAFYAAVVNDAPRPYLIPISQGLDRDQDSPESRIVLKVGSQTWRDWQNLGASRGFRITIGNTTSDVFPNFAGVNSMDDVATQIQTALDAVPAFDQLTLV